MVDFIAILNNPIYIRGILTEPQLKLIASSKVTSDTRFYVALLDPNGKQVTDNMTITMSRYTDEVTTDLGDYLNAQWDSKGLQPGLYLLRVIKQDGSLLTALPMFLSEVAVSEPPTGKDNLAYYILQDKVTGTEARLPPTISNVPVDDRYNVFAYYHDGEKGRLVQFDTTSVIFDSGWGRYAILEQIYEFNTLYDLSAFMITHSYGLPGNLLDRLIALHKEGRYLDVIELTKPYVFFQTIGRAIKVKVDTPNKKIIVTTKAWIGLLDRIATNPILAGCIGVGAIGTYIGFSAGSTIPGIGSAIGALAGAISGCVLGAYTAYKLSTLTVSVSPNTDDLKNTLKNTIDEARQINDQYHNDMINAINDLEAEGKIAPEDAELLRNLSNEWHDTISLKLDEIEEEAVKDIDEAYKRGYNEGYQTAKDKYFKYAVGSGVGGLILGLAVK